MPAALIGGVIAGVGSLASGVLGSSASESAASTQAAAANQAAQLQKQEFDTTTTNLSPFLQGGQNSLQALLQQLGIGSNGSFNSSAPLVSPLSPAAYQTSPGYQWQLGQGTQAVQNAASATGGIKSGNTLKALTQYGQGLANQDYSQAFSQNQSQQDQLFNMLQTVTGSGQNAGAQLGSLGAASANNVGNYLTQGANATAAGTIGAANAIGGGLSGAGQNTLLGLLLSQGGIGGAGGSSASGYTAQNSII